METLLLVLALLTEPYTLALFAICIATLPTLRVDNSFHASYFLRLLPKMCESKERHTTYSTAKPNESHTPTLTLTSPAEWAIARARNNITACVTQSRMNPAKTVPSFLGEAPLEAAALGAVGVSLITLGKLFFALKEYFPLLSNLSFIFFT
jgi:hypothetical protein